MSWCKIDDQYTDHPKIVDVGPLGLALHVACMCYCARYLTDGFVPEKKIPTMINLDGLCDNSNAVTHALLLERLTTNNLLEKVDGGYYVHDYLKYNPDGKTVKAEREANAARQKRNREKKVARNGNSNGVTNGDTVGTPYPYPYPLKTIAPDGAEREPEVDKKPDVVDGILKYSKGRDPFENCPVHIKDIVTEFARVHRKPVDDKETKRWIAGANQLYKLGVTAKHIEGMLNEAKNVNGTFVKSPLSIEYLAEKFVKQTKQNDFIPAKRRE